MTCDLTRAEMDIIILAQSRRFEHQCNEIVATLVERGFPIHTANSTVCGMCVGLATTSMGRPFVFDVASRIKP